MDTKRKRAGNKKWCESEKILLEVVYPYIHNKVLAERFHTTIKSLEHQAIRQRLKKEKDVRSKNISTSLLKFYSKTERPTTLKNERPMIYIPTHKKADEHGRVAEHILVMEKHLNRPLKEGERVFVKDGNRLNTDISNLYIVNCTYANLVDKEEIIRKRKAGVVISELRKEYNLTLRTLYKILNEGNCVKERK